MVCEKCEKKLNRVITPDVIKQPLYKIPKSQEETKTSGTIAIGGIGKSSISTMGNQGGIKDSKIDEPSIIGSNQRTMSGLNMQLNNKLRNKFDPLMTKCRICKASKVTQGHYYCQNCSYTKGICSMCGKKILDTKMFKQSTW